LSRLNSPGTLPRPLRGQLAEFGERRTLWDDRQDVLLNWGADVFQEV
jgi:hypothetical protein